MPLVLHGRWFEWTFLLADIQFPIIGVDFLRRFCLIVDPDAGLDTLSLATFPTTSS